MQKFVVHKFHGVLWQTFIHAACKRSRGILQSKNHQEKRYSESVLLFLSSQKKKYYRNTAGQKK